MSGLIAPNTDGWFSGVRWRTNRFGFRGPDVAPTPPSGVVRIVVIGDSVTAGHGLPAEEAYPAQLEALLDADGRGEFEVLNLGVPGAALGFSLARLIEVGLPLEPRVVVYGFTINDIEGPHYRKRERRDTPAPVSPALRCAAESPLRVVASLCAAWVSFARVLHPDPSSYLVELRRNYFENPAAWSDFTARLDELRALTEPRGICLQVLIHEQLQGWRWPRPQRDVFDRVVEAVASRGIPVADSRDAFRWRSFDAVRISAVDSHPNARGQAVLAGVLHDAVTRLPDRCLR